MSFMTVKEFFNSLDPKHPGHEEFIKISYLFHSDGEHSILLARKDAGIVGVIREILDRGLYPAIDQRLQIIFGVEYGQHMVLRADLYRYHMALLNPNGEFVYSSAAADGWTYEGMGYYFSQVYKDGNGKLAIRLSQQYKNDEYDKDVFLIWNIY